MNKVEICGVDTATLPMLSAREMRQLLLKVKSGDEAAREEFIRSNLRLVLSIVQRFSNRSEMMDDLFQVGCIGLIKAIDNFDLRHEVRFSTYAVPMIIGEIRRHLRDNNAIRVSRSLRDTAYKALQARNRLAETNGREPTLAEVAAELSLTEEAVAFALEAIQEPVSLFEPVYRDDGGRRVRHRPAQRRAYLRRYMARSHRAQRGNAASDRTGNAHSQTALFRRQNTDGGQP